MGHVLEEGRGGEGVWNPKFCALPPPPPPCPTNNFVLKKHGPNGIVCGTRHSLAIEQWKVQRQVPTDRPTPSLIKYHAAEPRHTLSHLSSKAPLGAVTHSSKQSESATGALSRWLRSGLCTRPPLPSAPLPTVTDIRTELVTVTPHGPAPCTAFVGQEGGGYQQ